MQPPKTSTFSNYIKKGFIFSVIPWNQSNHFKNLFANVGRRGSAISIRHSLHTVARKSCEESFQSSLMKWRKVRNYIKHANQSVIVESGYQGHCHSSSSHHKEKQKSINASPKRPVNKSQTRWGMLRSKYRSASLKESLKVGILVFYLSVSVWNCIKNLHIF